MTTGSASAPGKAVLAGEYAVLEGAPAISMAVNRRATVTVERTGNDFHTVISPGLEEQTLRFRYSAGGGFEWLDGGTPAADFGLFERLWASAPPLPECGLALTLDTRCFFHAGNHLKLGFGASSALAVAFHAALGSMDAAPSDIYRTAHSAHRMFQGGKGSGVDVATACYGGVIGFSMRAGLICRLRWPDDLHYALLASGKPASTTEKLSQLDSIARGRTASASAGKLCAASVDVLECWQNDGSAAIVESLRAYTAMLGRFSADHELGVFDAGHRELFGLALECGVVYKPCGAGGGDVGAVFALDETGIGEFARRARACGFDLLDTRCDSRGAIKER